MQISEVLFSDRRKILEQNGGTETNLTQGMKYSVVGWGTFSLIGLGARTPPCAL